VRPIPIVVEPSRGRVADPEATTTTCTNRDCDQAFHLTSRRQQRKSPRRNRPDCVRPSRGRVADPEATTATCNLTAGATRSPITEGGRLALLARPRHADGPDGRSYRSGAPTTVSAIPGPQPLLAIVLFVSGGDDAYHQ
jgi:hypothetical protein